MAERSRQIPTRRRIVRAFQRNYLRNARMYSGCVRFERLRDRFGDAVKSLLQDLVKDGILQLRNCGAEAYELTRLERLRLSLDSAADDAAAKDHPFWSLEMDLLDLGPNPTAEARKAACTGMPLEVYRLQKKLSQLPIVPTNDEIVREREQIVKDLLRAARKAHCVSRINLAAGIWSAN